MTWLYTAAAVVLGGALPVRGLRAAQPRARRRADSRAMRLFHGSISYLSLLFLVVAIDPFLA